MNKQFCRIALTGMLAMGLALCSAPIFAQDSAPQQSAGPGGGGYGRRGMDPDAQLSRYTARYNLTADQQSQIKPLLEDQQKQMQTLMQDQSVSREDRRSKMMSLRSDTNTKIRALLTDDQKAKWDSDQAAMQQRMQQRGGGGGGAPQQ